MKEVLSILLILSLSISGSATAQILNDSGQQGKMLLQTKKASNLNSLVGSPYENEEFQPGKVMIRGNKPINGFLRYDVLNEEIEIKLNKKEPDIFIIPDKKNTEYGIGSNKYVYKNITAEGKVINGYFIEYYTGENVNLIKKLSATKTEPYKAQSGYKKDRPSQILIEEKYFLSLKNGAIFIVKLRAKDFKEALPKTKEIDSYFSDNKIKDLEDIINLLKWFDQQD